MANMQAGTNSTTVVAQIPMNHVSSDVKTWGIVFALTSSTLFAFQPSSAFVATFAVAMLLMMVAIIHQAVDTFQAEEAYNMKQRIVSILAPAQFSALIWIAVIASRAMIGTSLMISTLSALAILVFIVFVDALLSAVILLAAQGNKGTAGTSVAAFISSKYAGFAGKIS